MLGKTLWVVAILLALCATTALAAVNVNTADAEQLATLDGIGDVKAESIIEYREEHGQFDSIDQLTEVNGIGDKTVEGLRDEAVAQAPSTSE